MPIREGAIRCAANIRCIILDVDGVLTDGRIYVAPDGRELCKPFFVRDGLIITLARKVGLTTAIITGRTSEMVASRAKELHIELIYQGSPDKRAAYRDIKERTGLADKELAYIGDDIVDLPILQQVGLPCAVGDAVPEVRAFAQIIAAQPGGHGAVREIYEIILKAQGRWDSVLRAFQNDMGSITQ